MRGACAPVRAPVRRAKRVEPGPRLSLGRFCESICRVLAEGTVLRSGERQVAWASWGDPAGRPLMLVHGTPGSRLDRDPDSGHYERRLAHVVTFDRPGY